MIYYIGQPVLVESKNWESCSLDKIFEYFKDHKYINLDTETQGKDWFTKKIILVQFGDYNNQFVVDTRFINISLLKEFIENPKYTWILQNAKFDYKFFKANNILLEKIYDTMLAECVIYCGYEKFGYSLANLCQRYLDVTLDKETRGDFFKLEDRTLTDKQIEYAALDVKYLGLIKDKQDILAKKYDLEYCISLENEVLKALGDIEYNGMYLNSEKWLQNALEADTTIFDLQRDLDTIIVQDPVLSEIYKPTGILNLFDFDERALNINYSSPLQIKKLCSALGYEVLSTNDRELKKLEHKHVFFKVLQEYRKTAKIISTYGRSFLDYINKSTNRVHTSFWAIKDTGRVSSGSKSDNAPNLQNIPRENKFRNCFEARPGFVWISADFAGQELSIMAEGSQEQSFIDIINSGEDLHSFSGTMMFKKPVTKADKDLRTKAKTVTFGKVYGMGPPKLADTLDIPIEEAQDLFKKYEAAFPTLTKWLKDQGNFAKKNMYSVTFDPCKRRRWYPEMQTANELRRQVKAEEIEGTKEIWKKILQTEGQVERYGANHRIQGTGADVTKEALVGVRNLIKEYPGTAYLINTVHDEINTEVKEELAQEFSIKKKEIMINCGKKYLHKVKLDVDINISKIWTK